MKDQIKKFENSIKKIKSDDESKRTDLNDKITKYTNKLKAVNEKRIQLEEDIKMLEEQIKNQSCSHKEKINLLKLIEMYKEERDVKKETLEHLYNLKQDYDTRLNEERDKVCGSGYDFLLVYLTYLI